MQSTARRREQLFERRARHPWLMMGAALCCAAAGRMDLANSSHDELEARAKTSYVQIGTRALCALAAGRVDEFYELLHLAVDARDAMLALCVGHWPVLRSERGTRKFDEVLVRMGWPVSAAAAVK